MQIAGVSSPRISALYPFDLEEWKPACSEMAYGKEAHRVDARALVPSMLEISALARCLSDEEPAARIAWDAVAVKVAPSPQGAASHRLHRLLLCLLLLRALEEIQQVQNTYDQIVLDRAPRFLHQMQEMLEALSLTPETVLEQKVSS